MFGPRLREKHSSMEIYDGCLLLLTEGLRGPD